MTWSKQQQEALIDGLKTMGHSGFAVFTWALVTGIAMAKSDITTAEAVGMSLLVYAGSAQLAALPLIAGNFPFWTIFLTAIIVNLRFVIFSAGIQPYFKDKAYWKRSILGYINGDLTFALFMSRYPSADGNPSHAPFFIGMAAANWTVWQTGSLAGIFLASFIPSSWGLAYAGTLALIAILLPMLEGWSSRLAAIAAAVAALATVDLPYKLNIVIAVLVAIIVGIVSESYLERRFGRSTQ
ncbi:AzlC family ABC transporter permease [Polynucleobacter victoriensis]|uniref:Predicted branched-chain amino acid permease (Azaleucine resistance) n=1 Tax=Polynucleobacter victoriensis TaxID=2049319 RepID=A0A212TFZ0_9BURK|nr:AzlC family ABC transporter permease [Polynucleobacter victoriensis]SNC64731.1 Predicted branched-chain amino acid permease (azaleucine resistance) [Polynucleobacter victoriensis]